MRGEATDEELSVASAAAWVFASDAARAASSAASWEAASAAASAAAWGAARNATLGAARDAQSKYLTAEALKVLALEAGEDGK
jgi:hypothetical protein